MFPIFAPMRRTMIFQEVDVEEEVDVQLDELLKSPKEIVLYDDDVHTFEFVIESLIKVCKHTAVQAEQCTYLVHYTGKCAVKRGEIEKLKPMCTALLDRGLSAEII